MQIVGLGAGHKRLKFKPGLKTSRLGRRGIAQQHLKAIINRLASVVALHDLVFKTSA